MQKCIYDGDSCKCPMAAVPEIGIQTEQTIVRASCL